ncbi:MULTISPECIES: helix-turn-helix domain-containing protein [Mycobacterium avium complex (MAC)]|nr:MULTISPECIES: helix-turn-helix transcriptional regulator [Mycobacterium avium complex (MAC)]
MSSKSALLRKVMTDTGTTQSELARLSGVHQPSISQFLSTKVDFTDELLDRLLSCMGYRLEVTRHATTADLTPSERRSWLLHRQLATHLTRSTLPQWRATILANLDCLRSGVRGQPHRRNIDRWQTIVEHGDIAGLRRALTGLDRDCIEMREVTPMAGLLPDEERKKILRDIARSRTA